MHRFVIAVVAGVLLGAAGTFVILNGTFLTDDDNPAVVRDIADVPKMSGSDAARHRENRYQDIRQIEQVMALPSRFAQTEALYMLAGRSDSGAVQNLVYEANRIADASDRGAALDILFSRLTELDPPSALALSRVSIFTSDRTIEAEIWRSWGRYNLDDALGAAAAQGTASSRSFAAQALFSAYGYQGNEVTDRIEFELGIGPDRNTRNAYLYSLADRSPAEAIRYVNNMRPGRTQNQSISTLAYRIGNADPDGAARYADLITDPALRKSYLSYVASAIAAEKPEETLRQLLATPASQIDQDELYSAMRALVGEDIELAMQYLDQLPGTEHRDSLSYMIITELANQDPTRAIEWARANDRGNRKRLFEHALARIAATDPQLAMAEAASIQHAGNRGQAYYRILNYSARNDPATAAQLLLQISSRRDREMATNGVVFQWVREDPNAAVNWILENDEFIGPEILSRVSSQLVDSDVNAAIRLLPQLDDQAATEWRQRIAQSLAINSSVEEAQAFIRQFEGSQEYGMLQVAIAEGVAHSDVYQAKLLADQLPRGTDRDAAYVRIISEHANTNPAEAVAWLASIEDAAYRSNAVRQLMSSWSDQEPAAATQWADNLPQGATRDDAIVSLASGWKDLTPAQERMMNSIGDAEKRNEALTRQIYNVAQTNWRKAQAMLDASILSSAERNRVQRNLDRYRGR